MNKYDDFELAVQLAEEHWGEDVDRPDPRRSVVSDRPGAAKVLLPPYVPRAGISVLDELDAMKPQIKRGGALYTIAVRSHTFVSFIVEAGMKLVYATPGSRVQMMDCVDLAAAMCLASPDCGVDGRRPSAVLLTMLAQAYNRDGFVRAMKLFSLGELAIAMRDPQLFYGRKNSDLCPNQILFTERLVPYEFNPTLVDHLIMQHAQKTEAMLLYETVFDEQPAASHYLKWLASRSSEYSEIVIQIAEERRRFAYQLKALLSQILPPFNARVHGLRVCDFLRAYVPAVLFTVIGGYCAGEAPGVGPGDGYFRGQLDVSGRPFAGEETWSLICEYVLEPVYFTEERMAYLREMCALICDCAQRSKPEQLGEYAFPAPLAVSEVQGNYLWPFKA